MSRTFLKGQDDPLDDLPDWAVFGPRNFVTANGLVRIKAEIAALKLQLAEAPAADRKPPLVAIVRDLRYWAAWRLGGIDGARIGKAYASARL